MGNGQGIRMIKENEIGVPQSTAPTEWGQIMHAPSRSEK